MPRFGGAFFCFEDRMATKVESRAYANSTQSFCPMLLCRFGIANGLHSSI